MSDVKDLIGRIEWAIEKRFAGAYSYLFREAVTCITRLSETRSAEKITIAQCPAGFSADYAYGWNDCINALAARQPVGVEPVAATTQPGKRVSVLEAACGPARKFDPVAADAELASIPVAPLWELPELHPRKVASECLSTMRRARNSTKPHTINRVKLNDAIALVERFVAQSERVERLGTAPPAPAAVPVDGLRDAAAIPKVKRIVPRKVVKDWTYTGADCYRYTLSCGHVVDRLGIPLKGTAKVGPAMSCKCYACADALATHPQQAAAGGDA